MDGNFNSHFESHTGFWGTTLTPFCEIGYYMTPYIAEFWNCISNIWYLVFGIPALISCKRNHFERRFFLLCFFVLIIGFGSGAYHMTMLPSWSPLDTAPMMGFQFSFSYIFTVMGIRPGERITLRSAIAIGYGLLCLLMFMLGWAFPAAFNILFLSIIAIYVPLSFFWCVYRVSKWESVKRLALWLMAGSCFGLAAMFWILDKKLCFQLRNARQSWSDHLGSVGTALGGILELHAWWHFFTAAALHAMTVLGEYIRCAQIGQPARYRDLLLCLKVVAKPVRGDPCEHPVLASLTTREPLESVDGAPKLSQVDLGVPPFPEAPPSGDGQLKDN
ncbi:putative dihydroceramidase [Paratrimastix pyriformis]|uniref:Dihydroceramidase n=1 Tax=Paratrimastix pyriformis TaxID=342808 RepID=A0ABQ8UBC7_9EUKA|nr:putative dihydroceramidase [Paratrimastix pyriformis]